MKATPTSDRILVKQDEAPENLSENIVASAPFKKKPNKGYIIATGPGLKDKPMELSPGQYVQFQSGIGTTINLTLTEYGEEEEYLLMRQDHVLVILTTE